MSIVSGIKTYSKGSYSGGIIGKRSSSYVSITNCYFVGRTFLVTNSKRGGILIGGGNSDLVAVYPVENNFWDTSYISGKPFISGSGRG